MRFLSGQITGAVITFICIERIYMKRIKIFLISLFMATAANAASGDFMMAAQLLAAAKSADIQQVQSLVNNGANINFVDSTGLSIVCTALMNNDVRAAQILQMYGADASRCDSQIKQYNKKNKSKGSGGLFSGLSSAQTISLAAAGAAVVVGGLFLLTDVFDPGNDNESGTSGGNRPDNNNGGGSSGGAGTAFVTVPYSPAYLGTDGNVTTSDATYQANLLEWDPSAGGVREWDFNYFRPTVQTENNYLVDGIKLPMQNYLLMMHGYAAFANEYLGQKIFRNEITNNPVLVANDAGGGVPVIVGLVTANGVNATGAAARGDGIEYANSAAADATTYLLDKYLNYNNPSSGVLGAEIAGFDFSGSGTAMNPFASAYDSALGKIVAGWNAGGRSYGDLFGFVPNGRLGVYRTGGGTEWISIADPTAGGAVGTLTDVDGTAGVIEAGDTITINGITYNIESALTDTTVVNPTITVNGTTYKLADGTNMLKGVCTSDTDGACDDVSDIAIYVGVESAGNSKYYYVNTTGGDTVDAVYTVDSNNIYKQKELVDSDYKNFQALYAGRSVSNVLANVSVIEPSRDANYLTVNEMPALLALSSASDTETFMAQIDSVYDRNSADTMTQGAYANSMFNGYGASSPILVMPAGEFEFGSGTGKSLSVLDATFENYAPVIYGANLEHNFMTVVAVQHSVGTTAAGSIGAYGNGIGDNYGPLYLSMWTDTQGTDNTDDDVLYSARKCGVAGLGINGIDPWCFSAAGATSEMATASAAGAVAALKGAFDYMSNKQIFYLMALTADGWMLGTDDSGTAFTSDTLANYLQAMYSLPPEYYADTLDSEAYLAAFAEVYGYGLINLDRAMRPNHKVYYYNGTDIVSADGNAYWRAASNTAFRSSSVLNPRGVSIAAPFFDILESVDGKMSLPRVWENSFALGAADARALYMGDVLGELTTRRDTARRVQIGNIGFSMAMSERAYVDNMNGLDNMSLDYRIGNWNFGASYQHYFTDGVSRFTGLSNPVLGLATNVVTSDVAYNFGNWTFGTRAFSGAITDEGLLENDPTISSQYMPAKLGLMQGAESNVGWKNDKFMFSASVGTAVESDTLLGAQSGGLLNLGTGDTTYVDALAKYNVADDITLTARATFARTVSDASGEFILGLTDIESNAFALGASIGNFDFAVSQPLAVHRGALRYAAADYEIVDDLNGGYELNIVDTRIADLSLRPESREMRFNMTYRHNFGEFTDGAIGFIYRINPNHTDEFGNESIFMMKLTHRLGI